MEDVTRATPGYDTVIELARIPRQAGVLSPKLITSSRSLRTRSSLAETRGRPSGHKCHEAVGVTDQGLLDVVVHTCGAGIHAITVGVSLLAKLMAEQKPR